MSDRPEAQAPQVRPLVAVSIGAVIGIVVTLAVILDLGPLESALIVLPVLVLGAPAFAFYLWARRRGDL